MKTFGKLVLGVFAGIGAFYIFLLVVTYATFDACEEYVLAQQVSPDRKFNAKHIRRSCPDGRVEHMLSIEEGKYGVGDSATGYVFFKAEPPDLREVEDSLPPLRIWWEGNTRMAIGYPREIGFHEQELHGIDVRTYPFRLEPSARTRPPANDISAE